ncbi:MAG: tetratricopeptide repeat protein, partial [Gemmatimonadetes bacterium]|nr:tetratricopeptide repeat protein [Gemmatimonadota bacterium]MYC91092.1 tetratricopeptide repeat protein [Gemmatimonadota bacterium]MYJ18410.1 tetratricopeptide repeat protein [Gemmatimonadota bacterium]
QQTHRSSACYLFGSMTCVDCHAPHSQNYRDAFGNPLRGRFDDGQCTACHAGIAAEPEQHTFHPAGSPGAACVGCHMPYIQHPELSDAIPYGRSDHTIAIPRPGVDEAMGLASACAQCHGDMTAAELAAQAEAWWGQIRPHRAEVASLMAARSSNAGQTEWDSALTAAAALGDKHALAKLMALDTWVLGWVESGVGLPGPRPQDGEVRNPETEEVGGAAAGSQSAPGLDDSPGRALAAMAEDGDEDVRAVAAATLHATRGGHPDVRALLDRMPRAEADPSRLRARWAAALSQWAAAAERTSGPEAGLHFLRRAQEVLPDAPETLVALGSGLTGVGATEEAVQTYLEALRRQPDDPVALVNLGLGLETLGREAEAEAVYERATVVRPTEALAHLNLGNARFRRGDLEGAILAYRAAIRNDFGLSRAHFYLAVALVNSGRPEEALPSLYDGLEFAPGDEEILEVIRQVRAMLGLQSP